MWRGGFRGRPSRASILANGVARVGDRVELLQPPGITVTAVAGGIPAVGFIVVALAIAGLVQAGSSNIRLGGLGVAHIGDPVMADVGPTLTLTGSIVGTITPATAPTIIMSGTIETGSSAVRSDGRGYARLGDTALMFFPPTLLFTGTFASQPLTAVPIAIMTPVRGILRSSSSFRVS